MNSRLDQLLFLVDSIEIKSDVLIQSIHQSSNLIDSLSKNNDQISTYDIQIDNSNQYLKNNYQFANEFHQLNSRLYLLEHDLVHNDSITNNNIYNNLNDELNYLKTKYKQHDTFLGVSNHEATQPLSNHSSNQSLALPKSISVSNLALKPIKTKPNKVYKKKSHYKISNIFTNPILDSPVDMKSLGNQSSSVSDSCDSIDNIMDVTYPHSHDTTPEIEADSFNIDLDSKPSMQEIEDFTDHGVNFEYEYDDNDNESTLSNSPSLGFENFELYLRKSRLNLTQNSYPFALKTSISDASINSSKNTEDSDQKTEKSTFKFHNPIQNIKPSHELVTPTIEPIYYTKEQKPVKETSSESLLSKMINTPISSPEPKESSFSFLNFIQSPKSKTPNITAKLNEIQDLVPSKPRKSSLIGSSLTDSFLQLMQTETNRSLTPNLNLTPVLVQQNSKPITARRRKRNKLEDLKSVPKTKPITILNEAQIKRLPAPKLSSSSSLILESNRSFVIHGESSIFKKPLISNFSNRNLQDALNSNIT